MLHSMLISTMATSQLTSSLKVARLVEIVLVKFLNAIVLPSSRCLDVERERELMLG